MIRVVYLGRLADAAGQPESALAAGAGALDWPAIVALLEGERGAGLAAAVSEARVRVALNGAVLADRATLLARDGDEIAFLPPVSGG